MSYRDTADALRAYRERLASDLAAARRAADEASERAKRVKVLEKELSQTDELIASMGGRKTLRLLDDLRIAAPCKADWDQMIGDDRVRFCAQCEKNVYNLSGMPRAEAEAFLAEREGAACVRIYKRADGTVLTADCPVGVRTRRRRRVAVAGLGGGLMAAAASMVSQRTEVVGLMAPRPTMGHVAVVSDAPAHTESTAIQEPVSTETATPRPNPNDRVTHPLPEEQWTTGVPVKPAPQSSTGQRR